MCVLWCHLDWIKVEHLSNRWWAGRFRSLPTFLWVPLHVRPIPFISVRIVAVIYLCDEWSCHLSLWWMDLSFTHSTGKHSSGHHCIQGLFLHFGPLVFARLFTQAVNDSIMILVTNVAWQAWGNSNAKCQAISSFPSCMASYLAHGPLHSGIRSKLYLPLEPFGFIFRVAG